MTTIRIELGAEAVEMLRRPVAGTGGFQSLLRQLQGQVVAPSVLELTPETAGRVAQYARNYGQGGFQGRLDAVLAELTRLAEALLPLAA